MSLTTSWHARLFLANAHSIRNAFLKRPVSSTYTWTWTSRKMMSILSGVWTSDKLGNSDITREVFIYNSILGLTRPFRPTSDNRTLFEQQARLRALRLLGLIWDDRPARLLSPLQRRCRHIWELYFVQIYLPPAMFTFLSHINLKDWCQFTMLSMASVGYWAKKHLLFTIFRCLDWLHAM